MFRRSGRSNNTALKGLSLREVLARVSSGETRSVLRSRQPTQPKADNGANLLNSAADAEYARDTRPAYGSSTREASVAALDGKQPLYRRVTESERDASFALWQEQATQRPSQGDERSRGPQIGKAAFGAHGGDNSAPMHYQRASETHDSYTSPLSDLGDRPQTNPRFVTSWLEEQSERLQSQVAASARRRRLMTFAAAGVGFAVSLAATVAVVTLRPVSPSPEQPVQRDAQNGQSQPKWELVTLAAPATTSLEPGRPAKGAELPATRPAASVKTSAAMVPAVSIAPVPTHPGARLHIPDIVATAGSEEIAFPIELDANGGSAQNLKIVVAGLATAASFNRGARSANDNWTLDPGQLAGLKLKLPAHAAGQQLTVLLTTAAGVQLARLSPTIEIRPEIEPGLSLGKNEIEDKVSVLLEHGKARIADGDVIGARMFFKKAAESGDSRAAMAMGATFDPNLFSSLQVQGMVPDVKAARHWYERAIDLGSKDAHDRLDKLNSK